MIEPYNDGTCHSQTNNSIACQFGSAGPTSYMSYLLLRGSVPANDGGTLQLTWPDGTTVTEQLSGPNAVGPPPPPPLADHQKKREKLLAQLDLRRALDAAKAPCAQTAVGATAAVWAGAVPGVGQLAAVPATVLLGTSGNACVSFISRAYRDAQIYNDPPAKGFKRLARPARVAAAGASAFSRLAAVRCRHTRSTSSPRLADERPPTQPSDSSSNVADRITVRGQKPSPPGDQPSHRTAADFIGRASSAEVEHRGPRS
jgi:hypothetical protein